MGEIRTKARIFAHHYTPNTKLHSTDLYGAWDNFEAIFELIESGFKRIEERIDAKSIPADPELYWRLWREQVQQRGELKNHRHRLETLESQCRDIKYLKGQVELNLRAIGKIENQLEGDGIFDVKDIHRRLNIHRGKLNQHQKSLDALEQPPPEPATDKDGKPEGGLKFGDLVYSSAWDKHGIFLESVKSHNCRVLNQHGLNAFWYLEYITFKGRPEPPKGVS